MKKMTSLLLTGAAILLAACGNGTSNQASSEATGENTYTVGVVQLLEHPSLDAARKGFEEGLEAKGIDVTFDYQNAQNEIPNVTTIANNFVKNKVDLIYAISTPAAQGAKQATSETPIVFSAVTDAVESGLVDSNEKPGANVTGTSDAAPIKEQLALFQKIDPEIKTIGIIYNPSEANSEIQVQQAKAAAEELGLTIETMGVNNTSDIPQGMDALLPKIDALYAISDNTTASAGAVLAEKTNAAGKVSISAFEDAVNTGLLLTLGLSYEDLGRQSADMAYEILVNGANPADYPVEFATDFTLSYNGATAKQLGIDINKLGLEATDVTK